MPGLPSRAAQVRTPEGVPESVLDKAIHIFLEPAMAAVLITTSDNEARFGRCFHIFCLIFSPIDSEACTKQRLT